MLHKLRKKNVVPGWEICSLGSEFNVDTLWLLTLYTETVTSDASLFSNPANILIPTYHTPAFQLILNLNRN